MALTVAPAENGHSEYRSDRSQTSSLEGLAPELQANIFRHIPRPSDLKSLCRASKRLYDVAVKELYHTVNLEIGKRSDVRLSAMLHPGNAGLKHIRILRIQFTPQHMDLSDADISRVQTIVRMLIDFLPEHILEDFEWSPWLAFDQETFVILFNRQKRLQWLTAFRLDGAGAIDQLEAKADEHDNLYKACSKLAIYPESVSTLELGQFLLSKMSTLTELIVHTNFDHGPVHYAKRELNDTPTGPGLVNRTMFRHLLPFDKITNPPFAHLHTLRLVDVGLRHCADSYGRLIDFTQIEALRIVKCSGADALFSLLCKSAYLPRKLRYLEFQHSDNSDNDALTAVDDFLCLVEGIEDLYIDLNNVKSMPNIDGIIKHGKTLDVLLVHASETSAEELVWTSDDFQRLCSSVTKLRQLSCAWPASNILRTSSPSWDSYQFSISSIPRLVTLHISTFPSCKANLEKPIYTELIRWQSSKLLNHTPFTTSRLKLVAFGVSDKIPSTPEMLQKRREGQRRAEEKEMVKCAARRAVVFGLESSRVLAGEGKKGKKGKDDEDGEKDSNNQLIFLRSTLINADGKEEITAVPVSWALRQYIEPRSDVLDFELTRRPKMPIRDYASYMDEDEDDDMV